MQRSRAWIACSALLVQVLIPAACSKPADQAAKPAETPASEALSAEMAPPMVRQKWTGDLEEMVKRRVIRAGVVYSRTHYFIDQGTQRGIAYESLKLFEDELNAKYKTGNLKIHVVFLPMSRDELLPALADGRVDLVAAMLTVTPERQQLVDFSNPTRTNVNEIVVTGPGAPAIAKADDLSGREVFIRKSSSYYQSLLSLNDQLAKAHKKPVVLKLAPETLEDDDLLEMVNAGLVKTIIVDDYMAEFWKQVFPDIVLHEDAALRTGGNIAVALRKGSPQLMAATNDWIQRNGPKTMFGNMISSRYLASTKHVKNATAQADMARFKSLVASFQKYGAEYKLDWLLMAAQGYQESGLNQKAKSSVGAIGVMQVLPSTAADLKVGDISQTDANIHAGVKYIRFMIDQYYKDEPMDDLNKGLFAFASYNAGPGRIRQLRKEAEQRGLNPNLWFNNVEQVVSDKIGRETVTYVSNIYKYYVAYSLASQVAQRKKTAPHVP
ncbi:MAG TPA: transporter substrate-binding domain-containing protein [Vicinamibacterales bacterium]|nr:transporter substrate-binding domain-containing protein [Vicinamibacterales bacterium]